MIRFMFDRELGAYSAIIFGFWINVLSPRFLPTFSEVHCPDHDPPLLKIGGWRLRARSLR